MAAREASHAGSWYTSSPTKLSSDLAKWLDKAHDGAEAAAEVPMPGLKAIIGPHAGYSYSGPAAAWAYKTIDPSRFSRVFVLGPSHHVYLDGCSLSQCASYDTPVGSLPLDLDTIAELKKTKKFGTMSVSTDEAEHSIEMHLPYIRHLFKDHDIKIVPVLVGALKPEKELEFGRVLAPYLADPDTLFIVSSDFCHWGSRFSYTYYRDPTPGSSAPATHLSSSRSTPNPDPPIHESISALDHRGMSAISIPASSPQKTASRAHREFADYLSETKNTVCGRHPIGVLLGTLAALQSDPPASPRATTAATAVASPGLPAVVAASAASSAGLGQDWAKVEVKFVRYEQSSQCQRVGDSSVSYASAYLRLL